MPDSLEALILEFLERCPEVIGAYLFGSRARGDHSASSDIDLALCFDGGVDLERTLLLEAEIERLAGVPVEIVDLSHAGAYLALDAIRGERIFERDGRRLDELDLYILRRAGDLEPFERERRRVLLAPESR